MYLELLLFLDSTKLLKLKDTSKHQGLRNQLATILEAKGITDEKVLKAIKSIPLQPFIDSSFEKLAKYVKYSSLGNSKLFLCLIRLHFNHKL